MGTGAWEGKGGAGRGVRVFPPPAPPQSDATRTPIWEAKWQASDTSPSRFSTNLLIYLPRASYSGHVAVHGN